MKSENQALQAVLGADENTILDLWLTAAGATEAGVRRAMQAEASELLKLLKSAIAAGAEPGRVESPEWAPLRQALEGLSRSRAARGQAAGETSSFVLALKKPLFELLQAAHAADPASLSSALWSVTSLVDRLAQHTVTTFQRAREEIILRQQEELLELSTPVIKLWDGVLAVPMIGTLDSNRTQIVMETLLQKIVETESGLAIIDITGVPTVDTLVAQHLLKTVTAIRLMGADCIISGVRPQIAQTIVHLGLNLGTLTTKSNLADALKLALKRLGTDIGERA